MLLAGLFAREAAKLDGGVVSVNTSGDAAKRIGRSHFEIVVALPQKLCLRTNNTASCAG